MISGRSVDQNRIASSRASVASVGRIHWPSSAASTASSWPHSLSFSPPDTSGCSQSQSIKGPCTKVGIRPELQHQSCLIDDHPLFRRCQHSRLPKVHEPPAGLISRPAPRSPSPSPHGADGHGECREWSFGRRWRRHHFAVLQSNSGQQVQQTRVPQLHASISVVTARGATSSTDAGRGFFWTPYSL